jgi:hypothetical protein
VSFILDALKKLEREKETREPGVVMVGPVTWGGADRRRRGRLLAVAAAALVLVVALGLWWLSASPGPSAPGNESREATHPGGGSSDRLVSSPGGAPAQPARPSPPPAEEAPAPRTAEAPGHAPSRASAALPPTPRRLDLPAEETTPAAAGEYDPSSGETEPAAPGPLAPSGNAETLAEGPVETGVSDAPAAPTSAPVPAFRLTAISTRDGEPIALLNDRLVREGDRFDDVHIIRIGETEVEIEVDGERRTIGF